MVVEGVPEVTVHEEDVDAEILRAKEPKEPLEGLRHRIFRCHEIADRTLTCSWKIQKHTPFPALM